MPEYQHRTIWGGAAQKAVGAVAAVILTDSLPKSYAAAFPIEVGNSKREVAEALVAAWNETHGDTHPAKIVADGAVQFAGNVAGFEIGVLTPVPVDGAAVEVVDGLFVYVEKQSEVDMP